MHKRGAGRLGASLVEGGAIEKAERPAILQEHDSCRIVNHWLLQKRGKALIAGGRALEPGGVGSRWRRPLAEVAV